MSQFQSSFRALNLYHNYSAYDCAITRCLPLAPLSDPATNSILALVQASMLYFAPGGLTQSTLFDYVDALHPGVYSPIQLQAAFTKALSQGVLLRLQPSFCCPCVDQGIPDPFYTLHPNMDANPKNHPYVAFVYADVTSSPQRKRTLYAQVFRFKPGCVNSFQACCGTVAADDTLKEQRTGFC